MAIIQLQIDSQEQLNTLLTGIESQIDMVDDMLFEELWYPNADLVTLAGTDITNIKQEIGSKVHKLTDLIKLQERLRSIRL